MKKENTEYLSSVFTGVAVWMICGCCVLSGCSNEVGLPEKPGSVPLGVESLRLDAGVTTRTGGTPVTTDGATIRMFLTSEGGYTPVCGKIYAYTSGTWGSSDPVYVDGRQGKAVAVYDPNNVVTFAANSSVTNEPLLAQAYDGNKLWWYDNTSGASVTSASPSVAFSMKCAYARLKFSIKRMANYKKDCKVSRIVLQPTSGRLYSNALVDIGTGTLQAAGVTSATSLIIDSSTLSVNTTGIAVDATNTDIDWLVPAQQLTSGAGLTFRLTIDGVGRSVTVPASLINNGNIEAGRQFTINLKITDTWVILSGNIDIADWVLDGTVIKNEQTVVPEGIRVSSGDINLGGSDCTDDYKTLLSKLRWAEGNLRQQNDDGSGPTVMAGPTEYGHFYMWMSEYTGDTTSPTAIDPCEKLNPAVYGAGWRTPNRTEIDMLSYCTDKQLVNNNSVMGMWFMNSTTGLFLPAAGTRRGSSGTRPTNFEGVKGYYWCSEANDKSVYLLFHFNGYASLSYVSRGYGLSVRCVKGAPQ